MLMTVFRQQQKYRMEYACMVSDMVTCDRLLEYAVNIFRKHINIFLPLANKQSFIICSH